VRVADLNWMQLEEYLRRDDRMVLPLGSTEQHAYLSLTTDSILAERVAVDAAEPVGVPVLPALAYGITPAFAAYPGSPTLTVETHARVVRELLDSLFGQGFRRILVCNGHGGNGPSRSVLWEWMAAHDGAQGIWHEWYRGPRVLETARAIDEPNHANWYENFPWTRLPGVEVPGSGKPHVALPLAPPAVVRETLGDGSFGGTYQRSDEEVLELWRVAVEEVRALLEEAWP